jgi:hypothetical protein
MSTINLVPGVLLARSARSRVAEPAGVPPAGPTA